MGNRRKAREVSLQLLYEFEFTKKKLEELLRGLREHPERVSLNSTNDAHFEEIYNFVFQEIQGVLANLPELDDLIEKHSTHWKISRMASVDRNILRLAVFELLHRQDIPATVTINEAIEIGKKFGTDDSGAFINGVLDHIAKSVRKM